MKRILTSCMAMLMLMGCGSAPQETTEEENSQLPLEEWTVVETPSGEEMKVADEAKDEEKDERLEVSTGTLYEAYNGLTYTLYNNSDQVWEYGDSFSIEKKVNGQWQDLTTAEDAAFNSILYILQPGERHELSFGFWLVSDMVEPGTYRLVKQVNGMKLKAKFQLTEGGELPEILPLEELPENYGATQVDTDDTIVFTEAGTENMDVLFPFLRKVRIGLPASLRTVQDYDEGASMVIDVVFEGGKFRWRMWQMGDITEQTYDRIVTDGEALYLTNIDDWENGRFGSDVVYLLPPKTAIPEYAISLVG